MEDITEGMKNKNIYLDNNATTPLHEKVIFEIKKILSINFGNPSSMHHLGMQTRKLIEKARQEVASLVNVASDEIVFTSGGSEANNNALT